MKKLFEFSALHENWSILKKLPFKILKFIMNNYYCDDNEWKFTPISLDISANLLHLVSRGPN
jgi:hypothetical protein